MTPNHVDIRIPKTSTRGFLSLLPPHISQQHEPIITNLQAAVDYTYPSQRIHLPPLQQLLAMSKSENSRVQAEDIHFLNEIFFSNYQSLSTINQWMYLLESLRPELVQVVKIGSSYEGREILGIVIKGIKPGGHKPRPAGQQPEPPKGQHPMKSDEHATDGQQPMKSEAEGSEREESEVAANPAILMHAAQHAREWISVSTVCYIAYQLIAGYYVDPSTRKIVDEFEWKYSPIPISPPPLNPCLRSPTSPYYLSPLLSFFPV